MWFLKVLITYASINPIVIESHVLIEIDSTQFLINIFV